MPLEFTVRVKGLDDFIISEQAYREIEDDLLHRRDTMLRVNDYTFNARQFISSRKRWIPDTPAESLHVEVSAEQRAKNLRRLRWVRAYLLHRGEASLPAEERAGYQRFVAWYESPEQRAKRARRKAFRKEFFDVYFHDWDEERVCFTSWTKATDEQADPTRYRRDDHLPDALGLRDEGAQLAKQIMGAQHAV